MYSFVSILIFTIYYTIVLLYTRKKKNKENSREKNVVIITASCLTFRIRKNSLLLSILLL